MRIYITAFFLFFAVQILPQSFTNYYPHNSGIPSFDITDIFFSEADGTQKLYAGTGSSGLSIYNLSTDSWQTITTSTASFPSNNINSVAALDEAGFEGDIAVGTENGFGYYDSSAGTWTTYTTSNSGISGNNINDILINGTDLWLAHENGVSKFSGGVFTNYSSGIINALTFHDGYLVAASNNGVKVYNGITWSSFDFPNPHLGNIGTSAAVFDHTFYIGNYHQGLWSFAPSTGAFTSLSGWTSEQTINSLFATDFYLYIGTWSTGYYRTDGTTSVQYTTAEGLAGNAVRAFTTGGGYEWIATHAGLSKKAITPSSAPVLASPADGSTNISQPNHTFRWHSSSGEGNIYYTFQSSTVPNFASGLHTVYNLTDTFYNASHLSPATQYYWRVKAINAAGESSWSSIWEFTTIVDPPGTPVLNSPANNSTSASLTPTLNWNAASGSGTIKYRVQVSSTSDFSNIVFSDNAVSGTSLLVSPALNYETLYWWRARAFNEAGNSAWSSKFNFTTRMSDPTIPQLISPENGSTHVSATPSFSWTASTHEGVIYYNIQITDTSDQSFSNPVINADGITSTSYASSFIGYGLSYLWRVQAYNIDGSSGWSETWSFTTKGVEFYVDAVYGDDTNDGSQAFPFATIQHAVNETQSNRHDIIYVANGNYMEDVIAGPPTLTIIGSEFSRTYSLSLYSGITVKNFRLNNPSAAGEAIKIGTNAANITLENIIVETEYSVTFLSIDASNINVGNLTINRSSSLYGIAIINGSNHNFENINILEAIGSGIFILDSDSIFFTGVSLAGEDILTSGRGIEISNSTRLSFENVNINNFEMGVFIKSGDDIIFNGGDISNNYVGLFVFPGFLIESPVTDKYAGIDGIELIQDVTNVTLSGDLLISGNEFYGVFLSASGNKYINNFKILNGVEVSMNEQSQISFKGNVFNPEINGAKIIGDNGSFHKGIEISRLSSIEDPEGVIINNTSFQHLNPAISLVEFSGGNYSTNNVDGRYNDFRDATSFAGISNYIIDSLDSPVFGYVDITGSTYGADPIIKVESVNPAYSGASYFLDVDIDVKDDDYYFLTGKFTYDDTRLDYLGYISNGLFNSAGWYLNVNEPVDGEITYSGYGITPINEDGTLFSLNMMVLDTVSNGTSTNISGLQNDFSGNGISGVFDIEPSVIYILDPPGVIQALGDVTLDAVVNMDDFIALLYHLAGVIPLTNPQALINADFDEDGDIDIDDLNALYAFINSGPIAPVQGSGVPVFASVSYLEGGSANLPLSINSAENIFSFEIKLNYDPSLINYQAFISNLHASGSFVYAFSSQPGEARYVINTTSALSGSVNPGNLILKFLSGDVPEGSTVQTSYRINNGSFTSGPSFTFTASGITTSVEGEETIPAVFHVDQNYPNPFNPATTIKFGIPEASLVTVKIYDILGREVKTLLNEEKNAGTYSLLWNGLNESGSKVSSGTYIYRVTAGGHVQTKKMLLLK